MGAAVVAKQRLSEIRTQRRLTQEDLVIRTGGKVKSATISRIERNAVVPEWKTQEAIAEALGVSVDAIEWPTEETVNRSGKTAAE